jgi:hypothetical protein
MKIRVKLIANDEVEISFETEKPQVRDSIPSPIPTIEDEVGDRLKTILEDGVVAVRDYWASLSAAGYQPDRINLTRVRRAANVGSFQKDGQWWWFLSEPVRDAAVRLRDFLKDGERLASECVEHLGLHLSHSRTEMTFWIIRRFAGVTVTQKGDQSYWSVSSEIVEIAESFNFEDDRLELIEEDGCGYIGWEPQP